MNLYRKATEDDLKRVIRLAFIMHEESPFYSQYEPDFGYIEQVFNHIMEHDQFSVLAFEEDTDRLIGMMFGFISKIPFILHNSANEVVLYVLPEFRDGIVGPKMIKSFENWSKLQGVETVSTGVSAQINSCRVDELYRRMGYESTGSTYRKQLN